MLTKFETTKLLHGMRDELDAETRSALKSSVVLKCAVMLSLIVGLVWIGVSSEDSLSGGHSSPVAQATQLPDRYSRTVFEERRRRYIEANPDSNIAREAASLRQRDAILSDGGAMAYQND